MRVLAVDSFMFCNAGAYIYQELGYAMAWGAEWMTMLTGWGVKADEVASPHQVQHGHFIKLLHGARKIPRRSHGVGTDC